MVGGALPAHLPAGARVVPHAKVTKRPNGISRSRLPVAAEMAPASTGDDLGVGAREQTDPADPSATP